MAVPYSSPFYFNMQQNSVCVCAGPPIGVLRDFGFLLTSTLTNRRTPKKVHARRRLISGRRGVQGACSSRCPGSGPCGVGRSVTADAGGNVTKLDLSGTTSKLESKCLLIEPHDTSDLCCASQASLAPFWRMHKFEDTGSPSLHQTGE